MSNSSKSSFVSSDVSEKQQKKKKGDSNPVSLEERKMGGVKAPGKVAETQAFEPVLLKGISVGFSFVDFLGKPRWVETRKKQIHVEMLSLFREIRGSSFLDITEKYQGIEPIMVNQIQKNWPLEVGLPLPNMRRVLVLE